MTDEEKITRIINLLSHITTDVEYSEDPMSDSGGNFDDAYSMGIDYGISELANDIKYILGDE